MSEFPIFISHASSDDEFVKELREKFAFFNVGAWVDSREISGGDPLEEKIVSAINDAPHFIVILSPQTINSEWVPREIEWAKEAQQKKSGYKLIPILLPGVREKALGLWFQTNPRAIKISDELNALDEAFREILTAVGLELPQEYEPPVAVEQVPVAELRLELTRPGLQTGEGKHRGKAEALLVYKPADPSEQERKSKLFYFEAPLGPIEKEDTSWYLERYITWPVGYYRERAQKIEAKFPYWGKLLLEETLKTDSARAVFDNWQHAPSGVERRFSVYVDSELPEGSTEEDEKNGKEGGNLLLSLPWELIHDGKDYLCKGLMRATIRRRLPFRDKPTAMKLELPLRILLISPRPEEEGLAYINHRASAIPLVEAVENLGKLIKLDILHTPTLPALKEFLERAKAEKDPVEVLHFDGHGIYDKINGLGALCFENPRDQEKIGRRRNQQVDAEELGALLRAYRIPLVFPRSLPDGHDRKGPHLLCSGPTAKSRGQAR